MSTGERAVLFIVHFAVPCFILWLFSSTYYVIGDKELLIRYGPFRRAVPLDSIKTVRKTSNPASSPALSLKRLEISYGNGSIVLISPKDRDAFLTELRRKCPGAFIE
nr:PH domain-containing protein [Brevibacillus borstelensis]